MADHNVAAAIDALRIELNDKIDAQREVLGAKIDAQKGMIWTLIVILGTAVLGDLAGLAALLYEVFS